MSDETRYRIVTLLLSYSYCVGALARKLDITETAVPRHLKILRAAADSLGVLSQTPQAEPA
ncbi:MAG: ArsR family transcriptional regulator [Eubacteriales bacterium]|nr:ArsR family transcriptional regulator [Eubacteriales bacterium]MDD3536867.1 ArsR family transcriptional regulator [Eubacteriales bacterium]